MSEVPELDLKKIKQEEFKEKLASVPAEFYELAQGIIRELESDLKTAEPDSTKYWFIEASLRNAKMYYDQILGIRLAKISYEASTRKPDEKQDTGIPENMTPDELELYNRLYGAVLDWRRAHTYLPARRREKGQEKITEVTAAPPQPVPEKKPEVVRNIQDYIMVRVLGDIPTFVGMDGRNYALAKEDVATVPAVNALALISRKVAARIPSGGKNNGT